MRQHEQGRFYSVPEIRPGARISNYRVVRTLGAGGIGRVYLAEHILLHHTVAIKVHEDFPSDREIAMAFHQAASYLSQLKHPNIVSFINYGFEQRRAYMVMEYVEGPSLQSLIDAFQSPNGVQRALDYFGQLLGAMRYAHNCTFLDTDGNYKRGIIHGDIKPANILISGSDTVKVTDFMVPDVQRFLAYRQHLLFSGVPKSPTEAFGTPYYMAPEQVKQGMVSERTDVFSLGVTLYHMLTGKYPYQSFDYVLRDRLAPASSLNPYVPTWVDTLITKATHLAPERRFQTVAEMQREFLLRARATSDKSVLVKVREVIMGDKTKIEVGNISDTSGQIFIGKFNNVIALLVQSGHSQLAAALNDLKDAIMQSTHLSDDQKKEIVEVLNQIGEETAKVKPNRTLLRTLGEGLLATLKAVSYTHLTLPTKA